MGSTVTFNVVEAAKAMLSDPVRYGTVIAPAMTPEQHAAVAAEVHAAQSNAIRTDGITALRKGAKIADGVDDDMLAELYDALSNVGDILTALTCKVGDSDGGWSGYSTGRRAIPVPGGRVKVTFTV